MRHARKFCSLIVLASSASLSAQQASAPRLVSWIASWTTAQQIPEPQNALPADDLRDTTLRQIVHLSAGGTALRVHLSNTFGTEPLRITAAHIARAISPSSSAIDLKSDRTLTFAGSPDVVIPPAAEFVSDSLAFDAAPLSDLAISIHLDSPPARETGHPGSRATSWCLHGDHVEQEKLPDAKEVDHWYQISEVDVLPSPRAGSVTGTIVALGDSITDGHGATTNGNDRWTDILAQRLQALPVKGSIGVANEGIGGNHLLTDGLGPNALARLDRDVLAPAGVRWVVVFEGVNDLGTLARSNEPSPAEHAALVKRTIAAYSQLLVRAHAHGMKVYGATITPFRNSDYYHPGALSEADRQAVNRWIRSNVKAVANLSATSADSAITFDSVLDFDKVLSDPQHPDQLFPTYDSGDHLHPSPAGYKALAQSIDLSLF
jgi:lysophospholipase L1-like esterase